VKMGGRFMWLESLPVAAFVIKPCCTLGSVTGISDIRNVKGCFVISISASIRILRGSENAEY
jgi:hypothetical protein